VDAEAYRALRDLQERHWWFRGRRKVISALIADTLPAAPDRRIDILEAGCGYGGNLSMLGEFGTVSAFELDAEARSHVAARFGTRVQFGRLPEEPGFAGERFDLIVMLDVLEHIEEDEAALERLRAMLKPGGTVLLTVPALPWLWSHHDEIHHHKRRYSRRRLEAALRAAGLEPVRIGFFNALLLPLAIIQRLAARALGRTAPVDAIPAAGLNDLLARIFGFEGPLVGRVPMPLSLSFFALARSVHV